MGQMVIGGEIVYYTDEDRSRWDALAVEENAKRCAKAKVSDWRELAPEARFTREMAAEQELKPAAKKPAPKSKAAGKEVEADAS